MSKNKTVPNDNKVSDFLNGLADKQQADESRVLIKMMSEITGEPAVMWGPSIIGFGKEHYKYDSGREGDMPRLGFSPRKGKFSLYITYSPESYIKELDALGGKYQFSKACIYIKRLSDVDHGKLRVLINKAYKENLGH